MSTHPGEGISPEFRVYMDYKLDRAIVSMTGGMYSFPAGSRSPETRPTGALARKQAHQCVLRAGELAQEAATGNQVI